MVWLWSEMGCLRAQVPCLCISLCLNAANIWAFVWGLSNQTPFSLQKSPQVLGSFHVARAASRPGSAPLQLCRWTLELRVLQSRAKTVPSFALEANEHKSSYKTTWLKTCKLACGCIHVCRRRALLHRGFLLKCTYIHGQFHQEMKKILPCGGKKRLSTSFLD